MMRAAAPFPPGRHSSHPRPVFFFRLSLLPIATLLLTSTQALNHHPDAAVKKQAEEWLKTFQESADAWTVCDGLLHDAGSTPEVSFLCSQTLKHKVQRDFDDLPPGAARSLRESLVALLLKFDEGPVRKQLALAVASLAAHLPAAEWGGVGALQWLAARLTGDSESGAALPCLLELLTVFPQEAGSYRPAVRPDRRRAFAKELIHASRSAIGVIASCAQHMPDASRNKRARVLDAYAAWVRLSQGRTHADDPSAEPPQVDATALAAHPLTTLALDTLGAYEMHERAFDHAVDAVCELVRATVSDAAEASPEAPGGIPPSSMPLVQLLVPRVMALRPVLVAAAGSRGADDDVAKGVARLFAEVGEAYVDLIATVRDLLGSRPTNVISPSVYTCSLCMYKSVFFFKS